MTAPAAPNPAVPTQAPTVGLSPLSPTKIRSRVAILVAAIGAFVTLRIDRFMAIAKDTDWLPPAQRDLRIADPDVDWCAENTCLRLPQDWVGIAVIVGIITTLLVLYALDNARLVFPVTATTQDRKPTITLLTRLWWGVLILGIVVAVLRVAVAYDVGGAPGVLLVAAIAQVGAVLISVLILARLAAPKKADGGVDWSSTAGTFRRQRATIVLVVLFALFLLVIPIATQQVADALRSLTFRTFAGGSNAAFLVATAALMSATVLQVWRAADRADAEAPEAPRGVTPCRWFVIGVVVVAAGLGLAAVGLTGWWGLTVLGLIFILFAVLERGRIVSIPDAAGSIRNQKADEARSRHAKDATPRSAAEREARASLAARYVAAIPLAALSIALVSAVVEMVIAEEPSVLQWLGPVVTAVVLGVLAVILTRTVAAPAVPRADDTPSRSRKPRAAVVVICVLLIVASVVLLFVVKPDSAWALAAGCAAAFVFMIHLGYVSRLDQVPGAVLEVRRRLPDAGLFRVLTEYGGTIPFAAASGLAVGLILHISPFDAARTLGTVALLDVFVAGLLGAGFYLSLVGRRYQAPWSLDWFGSKRLPVYTMLLVWWVIAGLLAPPALHDVRLVDREAGLTSAAPTLEQAFETWVAAQSDLAGVEAGPAPVSDDGSVPPPADVVPLVLVASHGGGIRAAYWTGLVLDCIIGANATAKEDSETGAPRDEEDVRTGACSENRRDDAQTLEAARRIFLASTVSGGAVGTAAYSQQILTGELTEGWIDERLSDDLLAPVIGWALFHDLPNHLVGLAPGVGGECRVTTGYGCLTQDRAAILEEAIDLEDPSGAEDDVQRRDEMTLRGTWHERTTGDADAVALATAVPLLVFNSSTTGSPSRAVTSAADLSDWPQRPADVTDEDAAAPRPVARRRGGRRPSDTAVARQPRSRPRNQTAHRQGAPPPARPRGGAHPPPSPVRRC